jgi:outer membrane protein assembly factor BamA
MKLHACTAVITAFWLLACTVLAQKKDGIEPPRIVAVEVRGNKNLNTESIISASGLKVGDRASFRALDAARKSLVSTGNYGMRHIDNPEEAVKVSIKSLNATLNEWNLLIEVEENDVVQGLNITGNGPIPPKEVQAQLQTKPGFVLNINTLRADVDRIQKYYDSKGYIANVSEEGFGLTNGVLDIPIVVGRIGPGGVVIRGLSKPKERLAKRELCRVLKAGAYYNVRDLEAALKRLEKLGIWSDWDDVSPEDPRFTPTRLGDFRFTLTFREKK